MCVEIRINIRLIIIRVDIIRVEIRIKDFYSVDYYSVLIVSTVHLLRAQMYDRRAEGAKGLQLHKMIPATQLCAFGAPRAQMYMIGAPKAQRAYNYIK